MQTPAGVGVVRQADDIAAVLGEPPGLVRVVSGDVKKAETRASVLPRRYPKIIAA
jgi:hypothetical protein